MIKLTQTEARALLHRLNVPDAISEATEIPIKTVERICESLRQSVNVGLCVPSHLTAIEKEILADCVEGSTWSASAADVFGQSTNASRAGHRTLRKIADKLRPAGVVINSVPNL